MSSLSLLPPATSAVFGSYLSYLLFTNTISPVRAFLIIWWGFVVSKRKTIVCLLVFNPLCYLLHCYPFSSQLVLNLTLALSWVQRGHLLKLCYKGHIWVLHLTVHELAFGGRNREKTEQARTYNLLPHKQVLYHCAISAYIKWIHCVTISVMFKNKSGTLPATKLPFNKCF